MPHLRVDLRPEPATITLDSLIARIVERIPDTTIIAEDWYRERRTSEERIIARLRQKGRPLPRGNEILNSIERAADSCGPTKSISIPMVHKGTLKGRISRDLILLHSDDLIDQATTDRLLAVLRPLGIVKDVRTSDIHSARTGS
jgi:hypothetical protein